MKKTYFARKRTLLLILLAIAAVAAAFTGVFSYAEFTQSKSEKRVLTTNGTGDVRFSSNLLVRNLNYNTTVYKKTFYTSDVSNTTVGEVTVCNYPQGNITARCTTDIVYDIEARLVVLGADASGYTKTDASDAAIGELWVRITPDYTSSSLLLNSASPSGRIQNIEMPSTQSVSHSYTVTFSEYFLDNPDLGVYILAKPHSAGNEVQPLDAVFVPALAVQEMSNRWEGTFNDPKAGLSPSQPDYDGFNYVITGYGAGECTLRWDSSKVEISQLFIRQLNEFPSLTHGSVTEDGDYKQIVFSVDSDISARYETQFYYSSSYSVSVGAEESATEWDMLESYVTLTFAEDSD